MFARGRHNGGDILPSAACALGIRAAESPVSPSRGGASPPLEACKSGIRPTESRRAHSARAKWVATN
eukprot:7273747-Alexandrium_andersonii.AAC.1